MGNAIDRPLHTLGIDAGRGRGKIGAAQDSLVCQGSRRSTPRGGIGGNWRLVRAGSPARTRHKAFSRKAVISPRRAVVASRLRVAHRFCSGWVHVQTDGAQCSCGANHAPVGTAFWEPILDRKKLLIDLMEPNREDDVTVKIQTGLVPNRLLSALPLS